MPLQNTTVFQLKNRNNGISFISVAQLELINLWKKFPLSITANVSGLSEECGRSTDRLLNAVENHELWALRSIVTTIYIQQLSNNNLLFYSTRCNGKVAFWDSKWKCESVRRL